MSYIVLILMGLIAGWGAYRSKNNLPFLPANLSGKKPHSFYDHEQELNNARSESRKRTSDNSKKKDFDIKKLLDLEEIKYRLMRLKNDRFVLAIKVTPVNYFLKSAFEQEGLDAAFESFLNAAEGTFSIYTQSRRIDLDDHLKRQWESVTNSLKLNETMQQYCLNTLNYVNEWQLSTEIYEIHYYLLLTYDLTVKEKAKFKTEEQMYKRILFILGKKANSYIELLKRAGIKQAFICTDRELYEMLFYAFRRRTGRNYKFANAIENEALSLYVTADRDEYQLEMVEQMAEEAKEIVS